MPELDCSRVGLCGASSSSSVTFPACISQAGSQDVPFRATESDSDPVGVSVASCESSVPFLECSSPASSFECEIPCGDDGLPSEETVSFLFDGVSNEGVTSRAEHEPAYRRLAALRERVLARLNLPNG